MRRCTKKPSCSKINNKQKLRPQESNANLLKGRACFLCIKFRMTVNIIIVLNYLPQPEYLH